MVTRSWDERETHSWLAWRQVGRHLHFAQALRDIAYGYADRLGVASSIPASAGGAEARPAARHPAYLAVHARHGGARPHLFAPTLSLI